MTNTDLSDEWINPDLVVLVREGPPIDGRKVVSLYLAGGFGREVFGTPEEIAKLLQST